MRLAVVGDNYTYAETNYANPHAPTAFFSGSATTTYSYDANGNLTGTSGAATSSFTWDYRNRMLSAWVSGATSTYQYDHTIARMAQITPHGWQVSCAGKRWTASGAGGNGGPGDFRYYEP